MARFVYRIITNRGLALQDLIQEGNIGLMRGEEMWPQIKKARYRLPADETIDFYVEAGVGHDDFLISLALLTEAMEGMILPAASSIVKPRRIYEDEERF